MPEINKYYDSLHTIHLKNLIFIKWIGGHVPWKERKAITKENERLRAEWSIQEAESEFDDELAEAYDRYSRQEFYTQTLHHKLPQREIRDYINVTQEEKKDLLLHFLRYDPEKPDSNDVTSEEYSQILSGTDHELIDSFLESTLVSLRSNLTFGPTKRCDDPKNQEDHFDPNFMDGDLENISQIYKYVHELLLEIKQFPKRKKELLDLIPVLMEAAETELAVKQGMIFNTGYKHTHLEPYDVSLWETDANLNMPKKRKT